MQKYFLVGITTLAALSGSTVASIDNSTTSNQVFEEQSMKEYTQVICTSSKIKEGCVEDVKAWLQTLEQKRRDETLESFRSEGVWIESAFIKEENGSYFLIYFMRAHDVQEAINVFQKSELSIDAFHKECWESFTEDHEVLTPVFHLESETPLH